MIRLAFSTNAFKKNTLEEAIDAIAAIGYRGVELMADVPHAYPPHLDAERRRAVRDRIRRLGLEVSNINAFTLFAAGDTYHPTWIADDPAERRRRIDHTLACVELAAFFGARTMSLQPGGPLIGTTLSRDVAGGRFAEGLSKVLPLAKQAGITLAIEPEPGLFIETAAEYLEFKHRYFVDEPAVRMNCDVGHLFCVGDDPAEVIRENPQEIAHVHLEDIGANRVHQHLTPGKGAIDFRAIFTALESIGYGGWVTVELYPYETTAAGVAKMAWEHLTEMIERLSRGTPPSITQSPALPISQSEPEGDSMGASRSNKSVRRRPAVTGHTTLASGRFLALRRLTWVDRHGNERAWESADRIGDQRAVLIIATLRPSGRIVLIRQFRPPAGRHMIEFPAGLIDGDESPESAAVRELREETGYIGQVSSVSPFAYSSPGMTGEAVAMVEMTIDETRPENTKPIPQLDADEDIEVFLIPRRRLEQFIARRTRVGDGVDNKVVAYAIASR